MTAIGVDRKFGAGRLLLADARLALAVANHVRYEALQRTLGLSREQVNVVTVVLALTAADIAHDVAKRLPHPQLPSADSTALGLLGLSSAAHGVAGPGSRQITVAMIGGLAAPAIRAFQRTRAAERRVRTERIRRYTEAMRGDRPQAGA